MSDERLKAKCDSQAPLAGLCIVVTRSREQSTALVEPLEALGAEVLVQPAIEVVDAEDMKPLIAAARAVDTYDWVVLTSTNGVERFFSWVVFTDREANRLDNVKIAVVGSATAERVRRYGMEPDMIPADFRAEGLVECFRELPLEERRRILLPRAAEAREIFPEELRAMGSEVDVVFAYRLVPASPDPSVIERLAHGDIDVLTFASGGTARQFMEMLDAAGVDARRVMSSAKIASVGPVTTAGLARLGFSADIEAGESTMESLVQAIADYYRCEG